MSRKPSIVLRDFWRKISYPDQNTKEYKIQGPESFKDTSKEDLRMLDFKDRAMGCFVGLVVGDALGAPFEFRPRGSFPPVTDMQEGGSFHLKRGEWTDDTSMALCLAESLLSCGGFDPRDLMDRFMAWAFENKFSSRDRSFGFGQTFFTTLLTYRRTGDPFSGSLKPKRAGNGCIMRLAPVPIYYYPHKEWAVYISGESARTTHGMPESIYASRLLGAVLVDAFSGKDKDLVLFQSEPETEAPAQIQEIARGAYRQKTADQIEGTFFAGKSLEAALWCFLKTDSYREAVLMAVNLGGDTDSTAAVCGQVAGAYYGLDAIPAEWIDAIAKRDMILKMAQDLAKKKS
jgi:ADP-ribosyl-[dinitrogen reductase] hydrolase